MVNLAENGQLGKNVVFKIKLDGVCKIKFAVCSVYKYAKIKVQNKELGRSQKKMTVHLGLST